MACSGTEHRHLLHQNACKDGQAPHVVCVDAVYYAPQEPAEPQRRWRSLGFGSLMLSLAILFFLQYSALPWSTQDLTPGQQQRYVVLPGYRVAPLVHSFNVPTPRPVPQMSANDVFGRPQPAEALRSGFGRRHVRAFAGAMDLETIQKMRIKEIKAELKSRGVGCEDCFEKTDLVNRLFEVSQQKQQQVFAGCMPHMCVCVGAWVSRLARIHTQAILMLCMSCYRVRRPIWGCPKTSLWPPFF